MRILLVEDDHRISRKVKAVLEPISRMASRPR
jgi:hypothetical protein